MAADQNEPRENRDRDEEDARDVIRRDDDVVDETSEDSFPASDPPSYSGTTAGESSEQRED